VNPLLQRWMPELVSAGILVGAALVAVVLHAIFFFAARRIARRSATPLDESFVRRSRSPARAILVLAAVLLALPASGLAPHTADLVRHLCGLGLIAAVAWGVVALTAVLEDYVSLRYRLDVSDNLAARQVQTRIRVLRRVALVVVGVVAISSALMTFPSIRHLGASLLASAGLAGLVVGMAARPALSNLIAGLQLAVAEPIRIDDVVVVNGNWGRIEEITTTYVVVRIWDLRRLIVPLSYFIEQPVENWTRQTADLLGTVLLYADYTVPVEQVRGALHEILKGTSRWDGKVWNLQVTNASEHTVELRALMSAPDSGTAWDLRCEVREKLIAYLQAHHPGCLPRTRAELRGVDTGVPGPDPD